MKRVPIHQVLPVLAFVALASCTGGGGAVDDVFTATSECQSSGNSVANCGFDTNLAAWRVNLTGSGTYVANDGSSRNGCIEVEAVLSGLEYFAMVDQCIGVSPSTTYDFGADARVVDGTPESCVVTVAPKTTADCTAPWPAAFGASFTPGSSWSPSPPLSVTMHPTDWPAVLIRGWCRGPSAFTVRFDDFFVVAR